MVDGDDALPTIKPGKGQGKVNGINIDVVENGFTASVSFDSAPGKDCCWQPGKRYVLSGKDQVMGFVTEALGLSDEAPAHWSRK